MVVRVRVLVAEDEVLIALTLFDILEAEGHAVTLAFDGAEALGRARTMGPALDVLVTDLNMPGLSGEDLIRALRAERPGLPVVVVTGSPPPGGAEALRRHGDGMRAAAEAGILVCVIPFFTAFATR
jgi:CheY-like chemotaxis protein